MRNFPEIKAFEDEFEVFELPASRLIGLEARNGGALGNTAPALWGQAFESGAMDALKALPQVLEGGTYGWTCEYDPSTDTFVYIVCVLTPAGTPVPEGFIYRDVSATLVAKGLYGESVAQTVERANVLGYGTNWEACGWNAELYLQAEEDAPPKQVDTPWHWLVPVRKS